MIQDKLFRRGRAWIELDRGALENNVSVLRARLPDGCALMPAVKANAYGHGAELIVPGLLRLGVHDFCVATAQEGAEVRSLGADGTVLVLGWTAPEQYALLREFDLTQTAADLDGARALAAAGLNLRVHLAVDTGMHRLGEDCGSFERIAGALRLKGLQIDGIFTHLCCADSAAPEDADFTREQLDRFRRLSASLRSAGLGHLKTHALNSGGILAYPEYGGDFVRPGIALYGVMSSARDTLRLGSGLHPVLSLRAKIAQVRAVHAGEGAGYGLDFRAVRESRLAVLTIGYADGLPRCLSNGAGRVLINGRFAPIAGRICMDQTLLDVTGIPGVQAGGTVTLIGRDGENEINACEPAELSGSISNELLSRLSARLERVWS